MKKVAIYARKSVEAKDSISIETQVNMCRNYFADEECEFEEFKDDGYSGGNTNRPAFKLLHKKIELNMIDTLICYKLDRLSRRVVDIADFFDLLDKKDIAFICVKDKYDTSTPMGRAMMYFASVFAQLERETIAERVRDSMLQLAKKGCWTGGPAPRGYELIKENGKTYLKLVDRELILNLYNWYLELGSLYQVDMRAKEKYNMLKGRDTVRRFLRSPLYVQSSSEINDYLIKNGWKVFGETKGHGYLTYGVTVKEPMAIVSKHEAVITPLLWLKVQEKLDETRESIFKRKSKVYWLSGVLRCPYCKKPYVIVNSARNHYYACRSRVNRFHEHNKKCKNNKYVNSIKIESVIEKYILSFRDKVDFEHIYKSNSDNIYNSGIEALNKKIKKNSKMIDNLVSKVALLSNSGAEILLKKIDELSKENKQLEDKVRNEQLNVLEIESKKFDKSFIYENILNFSKTDNPEDKRNYVKNIFKYIEYDPINEKIVCKFL